MTEPVIPPVSAGISTVVTVDGFGSELRVTVR